MQLPTRPIARSIFAFSIGVIAMSPIAGRPALSPPPGANPADSQATYRPEVRLRKLHLVRPDLIPYPIAYEVYC
jgi:hypothetical protein